MIRAVIFDMDGVIVNSMPVHFKAYQKFFERQGVEFGEKDWNEMVGMSTEETMEIIKKRYSLDYEINNASKEKELIAKKMFTEGVQLFRGVRDVLESLGDYKLALATSATKDLVEFDLRDKNILDKFGVVVTAEDVERAKPDPEIYTLVSRKLDIEVEECLVIEDSNLGIKAAKKAGMKCIGITNTLPREELEGADIVVSDIKELNEGLIRSLGQ